MITYTSIITTAVKDFLQFLRKPDDVQVNATAQQKLLAVLFLLIVELAVTLTIIVPVLTLIEEALDLQDQDYESYTFQQTVLLVVLAIPFVEELIFRHVLRYQGLKTRFISRQNWDIIFPVLVYFSVFCFAAMHLANYEDRTALFYSLAPIIVLSQFLGGLIMAYIRVRFNFLWGVLYHCTWNLIVVLLP